MANARPRKRTSSRNTERAKPLEWVRPPLQDRSQKTLGRLLAATEALLADRGFHEISVAQIARRARSSVGSFYARFPDKDAALRALHERLREEAFATIDAGLDPARWEGAPLSEVVSALIGFLVEIYRTRRGLLRAIHERALADADLMERERDLALHVRASATKLLLLHEDEIDADDPERAIDFAMRISGSLLDTVILGVGIDFGCYPLSDDEIAAETTRCFLAHLGAGTAPRKKRRSSRH